MWDALPLPSGIRELEEATHALGFPIWSDPLTLSLLRTLAATKVAGQLLELGTGTGISASWIRDGMDEQSRLITVDHHERSVALARRFLGQDARIECVLMDGATFLQSMREQGRTFDLIFADMLVGKYDALEQALALLKPGGIYVVDHLLTQPSWDEAHRGRATQLVSLLEQRSDLHMTKLNWSTGVMLAARAS